MTRRTSGVCVKCGGSAPAGRKNCFDCFPPDPRRSGENRVCVACGKTFYVGNAFVQQGRGLFCSMACRKTGNDHVCEGCGESFYVRDSGGRVGRFCSAVCRNLYEDQARLSCVCVVCGQTFQLPPSMKNRRYSRRYCDMDCRNADPAKPEMMFELHRAKALKRPTRPEVIGYALLESLGADYIPQALFGGKFIPDAVVPSARLVVQFDGDYWHDRLGTSTEARIRKKVQLDRIQDAYIVACGWRVVRLWESDLIKAPSSCADKIRPLLVPPDGKPPLRNPLARPFTTA